MIAVIFEANAIAEKQARYFQLAEELKPLLADIEGFISIERFQSLANPEKFMSLSWWENEGSIRRWKENSMHRLAQAEGQASIFSSYRIRIAQVTKDYSL
ncbi:antibiotic biosynthesis monooxygenase family protein [Marinomonas sp.]|uniref:antibiotic biosynthesis monooxygenase family protein n=1 Tax=Marinomonas sp. TaxID=1904862 RepID=UPI003BAD2191